MDFQHEKDGGAAGRKKSDREVSKRIFDKLIWFILCFFLMEYRWIAQLYPAPINGQEQRASAQYSIDMNAVTVSELAIHKPYFHHKYPM